MTRRDWSTAEIKTLKEKANLGAVGVAEQLGRSVHSVKSKAKELGITLRQPGSRRGLVLGQPRSIRLSSDMKTGTVRELVLAGKLDMAQVLERVRLQMQGKLTLCPECSSRPASVKSTGLCEVCHVKHLTAAAEERNEVLEARKPLQVAWQRGSRLRRAWNAEAVDEEIIDAERRRDARAEA